MVFCFPIVIAPLDKQLIIIIGSISGVNPTEIVIPNNNAFIHLLFSLFVNPIIKNTIGITIAIIIVSIIDIFLTPFSKLVWIGFSFIFCATWPIYVSFPTTTTIAFAEPEIILDPINAKLG